MQSWRDHTLKSLLLPGGILLAVAALLAYSGWPTLALPSLAFLYYCALVGGMLLAWRFHSSRIFFALVVLFLTQQAIDFFSGHASVGIFAFSGLQLAAILVPADFLLISLMQERGFTTSSAAPMGLFLFVETVIVLVLCQAGRLPLPHPHSHHTSAVTFMPPYVLFAFALGGAVLLVRALVTRKPADSALLWSLAAFFLFLRFGGTPRISALYSTCAACILAASIIENSYLLAYHDELTSLASRRAFNDALLRLQHPYSIAVVDIDHFKRFNDTYGHDTGDQVLRLVAHNLARVTGGGEAYRCGGEEFAILFPGKTISEIGDHLERLRSTIENAEFHMRGGDRRQQPRGPDRRNQRTRGRARKGDAIRQLSQNKPSASLSVTVSIGAAASAMDEALPDSVLKAADKALYRAKANGRNRVEFAAVPRGKNRVKAAGIA
ncbi:MAG TPA: GGDEF domain-containing protein [Terriglobales bacterium]|nr:GGDEF domain-containing protein [Terriglobales bacterium]